MKPYRYWIHHKTGSVYFIKDGVFLAAPLYANDTFQAYTEDDESEWCEIENWEESPSPSTILIMCSGGTPRRGSNGPIVPLSWNEIPGFMHEALKEEGYDALLSRWTRQEIALCWLSYEGIRGYEVKMKAVVEFLGAAK